MREIDHVTYDKISPWLPPEIIDCHIHIGLSEQYGPISPERYASLWPLEIALDQTWEQAYANFQMLFPDKKISALAFGWVYREVDTVRTNEYVFDGISDPKNDACGLYVTRPEWSAENIETALLKGFIGIKPYPDLAPQGTQEVSIFDFLPHEHLRVLNDFGGILMLHLPRAGRLADPRNIGELLEIAEKYPSVKLIVAHIGRAYCLPNAEVGLRDLADAPGIYFDTAANLNADVFECALNTIGPDRLLYGSDLPIMLMRGMREHIGDQYINYTDGSYSWNTNRKSPDIEANYTYYIYEEILAVINAIERVGLGKEAAQKIFYSNCAGLLSAVRANGDHHD